MLINKIREMLNERGEKPYRFMKKTGLAQRTAYDLVKDCRVIPSGKTIAEICRAYKIQPGDFLVYIEEDEVIV